MFVLNKTVCLFLLAIILIILLYVNWYQLQSFLQKSTIEGNAPYAGIDISEDNTGQDEYGSTDYNTNKTITSTMNNNIQDTYLQSLQADIENIQTQINSINAKLPYKLEDITASASQTQDLSQIGVTINPGSTNNFDSIQNTSISTATWELEFTLPLGQDGIEGPIGDQGMQGEPGEPGIVGPEGRQGPWDNTCSSA